MKINLKKEYEVLLLDWEVKTKKIWDILWPSKTIIYFYPKDNTPWCTLENRDFTSLKPEFEKLWYKLVWVSRDSIESHKKFVEKHKLETELISDPDLSLHKELEAYWEKNNYWKIIQWVIRSTFIVDKSWEVLDKYKNIKATWHANRILKEIQNV